MSISVGQLVKELDRIKRAKAKLLDEAEKLELREFAIVEELHKFYNSPVTNDCEIVIVLKRPL